jgi:hypothetical protein
MTSGIVTSYKFCVKKRFQLSRIDSERISIMFLHILANKLDTLLLSMILLSNDIMICLNIYFSRIDKDKSLLISTRLLALLIHVL